MTGFSPPPFEIESGYQSYKVNKSGQHHDGGYDAFMTGACFATMLKVLGTILSVESTRVRARNRNEERMRVNV